MRILCFEIVYVGFGLTINRSVLKAWDARKDFVECVKLYRELSSEPLMKSKALTEELLKTRRGYTRYLK